MTKQIENTHTEKAEQAFERRMALVETAIDEYHCYLKRYLYRLTHQWQDAENLVQDLWRYVILKFDEDRIGSLPMLRRKAYHLFIDHYRRQVRRGETTTDEIPEIAVSRIDREAYTDGEEQSLKEKFWSEFPDLPLSDQQKEVLWLHARYGFTYREINHKLGIAESTIGDWIAYSRQCLADAINNQNK